VGAAISADEIQIWTDVDGMLTCDPRVLEGGYRLRAISFEEAAAMALHGAKVLHPDSVTPAIRQRIPIVIRNSSRPELEGTRITEVAPLCSNPVKAIALKSDLTVMELCPHRAKQRDELAAAVSEMCERHGIPPEFVSRTNDSIFLALKRSARVQDLYFGLDGCVEVRLHPRAAIVTLVGEGIRSSLNTSTRALSALKSIPVIDVTDAQARISVNLLVPRAEAEHCAELLHREFFQQVDPAVFAESTPVFPNPEATDPQRTESRRYRAISSPMANQTPGFDCM
jgi:aspartate kinase